MRKAPAGQHMQHARWLRVHGLHRAGEMRASAKLLHLWEAQLVGRNGAGRAPVWVGCGEETYKHLEERGSCDEVALAEENEPCGVWGAPLQNAPRRWPV